MLAIVVSEADIASTNIGEQLLELENWNKVFDDTYPSGQGGGTFYQTKQMELRLFQDLHLHIESAATVFQDPSLVVFASRHSGDTGPLLSAHFTGNFGPATYGGEPQTLAQPAPKALSIVRNAFVTHRPDDYECSIECTHHGPTMVGCPSLFVELGSSENEWSDPVGAYAAAKAILELRTCEPSGKRTIVGFGGDHYAHRFDRIIRDTNWDVGHVASDWALDELGDPMQSLEIIEKSFSSSGATKALLDTSNNAIRTAITELGYDIVSETWLRETSDVPLSLVSKLEAEVQSIDQGLRFGSADIEYTKELLIITLPEELLHEINGIDRQSVFQEISSFSVAFETEEGATRVGRNIVVCAEYSTSGLTQIFTSVLSQRYDVVEVTDSTIRVQGKEFDPELATSLGVEPGPDFGKLAGGSAITIDGKQIEPADVMKLREKQFSLVYETNSIS